MVLVVEDEHDTLEYWEHETFVRMQEIDYLTCFSEDYRVRRDTIADRWAVDFLAGMSALGINNPDKIIQILNNHFGKLDAEE